MEIGLTQDLYLHRRT